MLGLADKQRCTAVPRSPLSEGEDGTVVRCVRPGGFSGQFSLEEIEDTETNGSYTVYIISINDESATVETSYEKVKDTTIDEHGVAATKQAVAPQAHVVRSVIQHSDE